MKLTGLYVDNCGSQPPSSKIRLGAGLNLVIDPNAKDNALGRLLRDTLFGTEGQHSSRPATTMATSNGWIDVHLEGQPFRLTRRSFDRRNPLVATPIDSVARPNALEALRELDAETFETFFGGDRVWQPELKSKARWLQSRIADATIPSQLSIAKHRTSRSLGSQPGSEFNAGASQLPADETSLRLSLLDLAEQIEACNQHLRLEQSRRNLLDRQIIDWEQRLTRLDSLALPDPQPAPRDSLARMYDRLDEIDCQWRAWREVQQVTQKRREVIRDELANSGEATAIPLDHPLHRVRECIQAVDATIDQVESVANNSGESNRGRSGSVTPRWRHEARASLLELGQRVEQQHLQLRQRCAAAELKQLRNCYSDIEKSVKCLVHRRHSIIEQIHALDPEGAELVIHGNPQFCATAKREGYWLAREQWFRPLPAETSPSEPHADLRIERWQLESAQQQRIKIHAQIVQLESKQRLLVQQRDLAVDRVDRCFGHQRGLCSSRPHAVPLTPDLANDGSSHPNRTLPEQVLESGSHFLRQLSDGRWTRIGISDQQSNLVAENDRGQLIDADRLDRPTQCQIALCLCLAVARAFAERGQLIPLFLCEPQEIVGRQKIFLLVEWMNGCCAYGQQIILALRRTDDVTAFAELRPQIIDCTLPQQTRSSIAPTLVLADSHSFRERASTKGGMDRQQHVPPRVEEDSENQSTVEPIFRFPIQRASRWSAASSDSVRANEAQSHAGPASILPSRRLRDSGVCSVAEWSALEGLGVMTIGSLLDANPESLAISMSDLPILSAQVQRWQACCWLLVCVPELEGEDAQALYDCGITAPQQLEEVRGELLLQKLQKHLTASGRENAIARFNVERINRWMRSLARTKPQWKLLGPRTSNSLFQSQAAANGPLLTPTVHLNYPPAYPLSANSKDAAGVPAKPAAESLRFHLQLNDSVNAAPSISSRVSQQLGELGIKTVRDFLRRRPEDIARALDNRRLGEATIRQWQQQARLACSIPNMRRHDAQILVACGICEPEQLVSMDPAQLFASVEQFMRSKSGTRLVRSGKKPDAAEVADWIRWARHTRSVQAA